MEFISNYNRTFVANVSLKYNKRFKNFEQYALYLFELYNCDDKEYYYKLEEDIREYCNYQQERKKTNGKSKS